MDKVCSVCGLEVSESEEKEFCTNCGRVFHKNCLSESNFCPCCGYDRSKRTAAGVNETDSYGQGMNTTSKSNATNVNANNKKIWIIVGAVVLIAIIGLSVALSSSGIPSSIRGVYCYESVYASRLEIVTVKSKSIIVESKTKYGEVASNTYQLEDIKKGYSEDTDEHKYVTYQVDIYKDGKVVIEDAQMDYMFLKSNSVSGIYFNGYGYYVIGASSKSTYVKDEATLKEYKLKYSWK